MVRDFRVVLAAVLVLSLPLAAQGLDAGPPEASGLAPERLQRLDALLAGYVHDARLAGNVTLVARHGRIVYLKAFGQRDMRAAAPMQVDNIFRIASQSKAIVSAAALVLQEEGRLLIQDPVSDYLPEFASTTVAVADGDAGYDIVPAERPITIRDLLTHTSGYDYGEGVAADRWAAAGIQGWYFADRDAPIGETVRRMAALPASGQPGRRWIYGYSTDILGAVLEQAAGKPLDQLLQEKIFDPLDMQDTHFYLPPAKADRLATVYSMIDGRLQPAPQTGRVGQGAYLEGPRRSFSGGAGLLSTAVDYARFLQMILNQGELDGVRVLGRKSVELMSVDHLGDLPFAPGAGFGLGFSVLDNLGQRGTLGSVGELGWGGAYHSSYWIDPAESLVVVYLTQLIPAGAIDDHAKLRALVYQAIAD